MLLEMKIQTERKHNACVFHYAPYVYEDTAGEEIPCVCVSLFSFIWRYRQRRNTMCLYFTMLFYMKIQTERKHHVFVFHHASLLLANYRTPWNKDTDDAYGEETLCVCISPCFWTITPWNKETDDTDGRKGNTMCLYFTTLLEIYNALGISNKLGSNVSLF